MPSRRLLLSCLLLAACPPRTPPDPPPGPRGSPAGGETAANTPQELPEIDAAPPAPDDPDAPDEPVDVEAGDRSGSPKLSTSRGDNNLADTLAPRASRRGAGRKAATGGCDGGSRRPGETWKIDCNQCTCGDDGQSTCTELACDPAPVR